MAGAALFVRFGTSRTSDLAALRGCVDQSGGETSFFSEEKFKAGPGSAAGEPASLAPCANSAPGNEIENTAAATAPAMRTARRLIIVRLLASCCPPPYSAAIMRVVPARGLDQDQTTMEARLSG